MATLSTKQIAQITTIERLTAFPYQAAKTIIKKMEVEQCKQLFEQLQQHIEYTYGTTNGYVAPKLKYAKFSPGDEHYIAEAAPMQPKDFQRAMGGIKKLEILYGYFFDKLNGTDFSDVR